MAIKIGVGSSSVMDSYRAGKEAAGKAAAALGGEKGDFALIFTVDKYKQEEVLRGINEVLGDIPLGGCCGTGVLTHEEGMKPDSVAVMVGKSDELEVTFGIGEGISKDAAAAGEALAKSLTSAKMDLNSVLITLP
ncbi:MAG: FIST N-terminal domain-containing protein, partial [Candidatus Margulisiibacteriota bacterium]